MVFMRGIIWLSIGNNLLYLIYEKVQNQEVDTQGMWSSDGC